MTKLLDQAFSIVIAFPDEAQDAVARRLLDDVETYRAKASSVEKGLQEIEAGKGVAWDDAKARLKERRARISN